MSIFIYRILLIKIWLVPTVHWIASPHLNVHYCVYRTFVVYLLDNNTGVINSVRQY
jgi:hypothetical protein